MSKQMLEPCPFCGETDIVRGVRFKHGSLEKADAVRCANCGAQATEAAWQKRCSAVSENPVAWQYLLPNGRWDNMPSDWSGAENHPDCTYRPLYAHPAPQSALTEPQASAVSVPVNMPFERLPQHAGDPGFGPVPDVVPLHPSTEPQTASVSELATKLLDFIDNEGPSAMEWKAISDTAEALRKALSQLHSRANSSPQTSDMREALSPFAAVAAVDIGSDEADGDIFSPIRHNHAPRLTVGDFRRALASISEPTSHSRTPHCLGENGE
jgi:predicted RNA-binding Zn-ribbon protein involved in translation (DUF1610 family)